ncbi:hydrolase 1, exosortase A system-associated [Aromatoleum sp.]|uniref:hydrolase 1, exosortase A system-associated n=1 Tax=Aromatoleum sp. TaxID=2307007 RepID=UPI002FCA2A6B
MNVVDSAFLFDCQGDELLGIVSAPEIGQPSLGVLVIVGGPQYRVGSHRQFVLLSRHLAMNGIACMRFDYRGMGDGSGEQHSFEAVDTDVRAALDAFFARQPGLRQVVLWGLCDGASVACFYAPTDERVAGLVLLNPWVKTEAGVAKTYLKHYYLRRLTDPAFWKKLVSGRVALGASVGGVAGAIRAASKGGGGPDATDSSIPGRMAARLDASDLPFAVFLSRRDYVAREFEGVLAESAAWKRLMEGERCIGTMHFDADHTFSSATARNSVADATLNAVARFDRFAQKCR